MSSIVIPVSSGVTLAVACASRFCPCVGRPVGDPGDGVAVVAGVDAGSVVCMVLNGV